MFGRADIWALKAVDLCDGHRRAQVWVLARTFDDASPARIAGDVEHGREGPVDADGASLPRRDALPFFFDRRIPGSGHRDGHGEDGAEAMNDVEAEDERDVEAGLLDGDVLELVDHGGVGHKQQRAELALGDGIRYFVRLAKHKLLAKLADLLLERHLLQQRGNACVDFAVSALILRGSGCGTGRRMNSGEGKSESTGEKTNWSMRHGKEHGQTPLGDRLWDCFPK